MLSRLKSLSEPIGVAIIGTGSAGKGLVYQCSITPGIKCVAIADIKIDRAIDSANLVKRQYRIVDSLGQLNDAVATGLLAISQDGRMLAQCEAVDVVIDASSSIEGGGHFAITAIENGKHIVMMNAEADLIFGPYLMHLAERHNVVYTSCDGDQPGVIRRLIDDLRLWGFELVMAGNIKGFMDRYSNPTKIIPEADNRGLDYKMCASYTDGTKLCVEMALVANAFGMGVATPGMYGPRAKHILDIPKLFDFDELRQTGKPVVDYVIGPEPKGGVFAVGYCDNEYQRSMLAWFPARLGDGPYYVFRRPYHLIHIEAMQCVAEAYLDHQALLKPSYGFETNVYCYAKRDLRAGETLDGMGGYTCYGVIENCSDNRLAPGFPICLAENVTVKRDIAKDAKILADDVAYDHERFDIKLYNKAVERSNALGQECPAMM
jgi:predicted homoserine dehydrogenase-like protein